ncbi:hypothetical protein [Rhodococcoides kyotonense]|uniref:Terminase n=1 Tax=Rhodococcoides kyotonense TaxID=398843 RepID=A0A239FRC5_9NOCA|nr:hypothetical protein [Rhodococcus kyotonensis]SNS59315.1 hypothetical protein SAMN05421642_103417 [Rhodococcus kyotonensis]
MTVIDPGRFSHLSEADKLYYRNRLAEETAKRGKRSPFAPPTPGALALKHEPTTQVQRPHLEEIDKALTWVRDTPNAKLMVWTPPRAGKSHRISRWLPFWWQTEFPRDRTVLTSYAASLAHTHSAAVRDLVATYGAEYGLFLKRDENTRSDWTTTAGGGLRARGVRGGLTGQDMELGIVDDPYADRAQADSSTIRKAVEEWYSSAFVTRRSPGARQIIVHTRWHLEDLSGMLLKQEGRIEEGGEWRVLHLPAIATAADPERGFYGDDALGRTPGEPLTHPKIDAADTEALIDHWRRQKQSVTTRDWAAMFMGSPVTAEGALLTAEVLAAATVSEVSPPRRAGVAVDPNGGGRDTAGIIGGHVGKDGKFYWTHDRSALLQPDQWSREACLLADEISADRIVFEANYGGKMAGTLIKQAWAALQDEGLIPRNHLCPYIAEVHARKSKFLRAEPIAQAVITGRAKFAPGHGLAGLKSEFEVWEPGSTWSPGALDAGVHLAYELLPAIGAGAETHSVASRKKGDRAGSSAVSRRRRR